MCSPNPYHPGRTYLVTPGTKDGKFTDGICFSGRDIEYASDVVEYVRRQFQKPWQFHIRGRVGATERNDASLADYLLTKARQSLCWASGFGPQRTARQFPP